MIALKYLGSDFQYETKLYITKNKNKIQNIVISFAGDPNLKSEQLLQLLSPLKNSKINGKIILDASIFITPPYSQGLMLSDIGQPYSTPVTAINIDNNIFKIQITPTALNQMAFVQSELNFKVNSSVITSDKPTNISLFWQENIIQAQGNINIIDNLNEKQISPDNMDDYIKFKVQNILKELNIKADIQIVHHRDELPFNMILINKIESAPLSETIIPALKKSDNLFFDSLYLTIIHAYDVSKIQNWVDGGEIIKKLIKQYYDVDFKKTIIVDGSGLSRYNQVQPSKLFELLKKGYEVPEFINALASPSEEKTTLLKRVDLADTIKAKTGSLTGISCLCGYNIKPKTSKVFVIVANGFVSPSPLMHKNIDNFINNSVK